MAYDLEAQRQGKSALLIGLVALLIAGGAVLAYFATRGSNTETPAPVVLPPREKVVVVTQTPTPLPTMAGTPTTSPTPATTGAATSTPAASATPPLGTTTTVTRNTTITRETRIIEAPTPSVNVVTPPQNEAPIPTTGAAPTEAPTAPGNNDANSATNTDNGAAGNTASPGY